ncbi:cell division protein FtsZ [bacterium]|nr:cell division protein FtsZ [bacterium]MBU2599029.1 cell division protein FtsZ [bacterium]
MIDFESEAYGSTKIKVIGIGGGGSNVVSRMMGRKVEEVEFWVMNTDAQALQMCEVPNKLQIGVKLTRGLGAGANPEVGRQAAEEDRELIRSSLEGADMVFVATGMGGGTGTGASSIVAEVAKELGALTIAVVTKPFVFEGFKRQENAERGIKELIERVDSLIVIPNQKLLSASEKKTTVIEAFRIADDVLRQGIQGVSDLVIHPGIINLDFADIKTVMSGMGKALMGIGIGVGENRAVTAAQAAINSPLLEDVSIEGARAILINITGGEDLTIHEVNEAASIISEMADKKANIIYGQAIDESLHDEMHITIIATGFGEVKEKEKPSSKTTINLEDYRYEKPGIRIKKDNLRREILIGPEKFLSKDSREIEEIPAVFRKIAD